jgi:hypothetical protein
MESGEETQKIGLQRIEGGAVFRGMIVEGDRRPSDQSGQHFFHTRSGGKAAGIARHVRRRRAPRDERTHEGDENRRCNENAESCRYDRREAHGKPLPD